MRKKSNITLRVILFALISLTACEQYNWEPPIWDFNSNTNPERPRPIDDDIKEYYVDHVAPLFDKYNCTGCHTGSIPPDLSPEKSEEALTGGDYLNFEDIEESIVALKVMDAEHGGTWNTQDLFTLLDWIYLESRK